MDSEPDTVVEVVDQEAVGAHNWPSGYDNESRGWGRFWIAISVVLSVAFILLLGLMARGRWPSKALLERCNDPNYTGPGCSDVEGRRVFLQGNH